MDSQPPYEVILLQAALEYYRAMPAKHQTRADAIMARLALLGPMLHRPHADHVRGKIMELRCGSGRLEHRFLFFYSGHRIILTHGFLKKQDAIQESEISRAERFYWAHLDG